MLVGVKNAADVKAAGREDRRQRQEIQPKATILGVQVQQMVGGGQEVIIGAGHRPSFGKLVAFGLGGVLVEVLKDVTFRLAPATKDDALSMLDGIQAAEMLKGVRRRRPVNRDARSPTMIVARLAARRRLSRDRRDGPEPGVRRMPARSPPTCASSATSTAPAHAPALKHDVVRDMNRIMKPTRWR